MADMNENVVYTRLQLKHDTYERWTTVGKDVVLLPGEIGICEIPSANPAATTAPTVLFKVGDGTLPFHNDDPTKCLKWASALAADVYGWAKQTEEQFKTWLQTNHAGKERHYTFELVNNNLVVKYQDYLNGNPTGDVQTLTTLEIVTDAQLAETLANYYTKTDVDNILKNYYTKTEVDNKLAGKKNLQNAIPDPTANGTALAFIDSISQNEQGVITATKKNVNLADYAKKTDIGDGDITIEAGEGLAEGGTFNVNQDDDKTITLKHAVPDGATEKTFGRTATDKENHIKKVITSVTTDKFGHVIAAEDSTTQGMFATGSVADGAEVYLQGDIFDNNYSFGIKGTNGISVTAENNDIIIDGSELQDAVDATDGKVNTLIGTDTNKSARAIATEVAKAEIGSAGHLKREIVDALPAVKDADPDTIYMIQRPSDRLASEVRGPQEEPYTDEYGFVQWRPSTNANSPYSGVLEVRANTNYIITKNPNNDKNTPLVTSEGVYWASSEATTGSSPAEFSALEYTSVKGGEGVSFRAPENGYVYYYAGNTIEAKSDDTESTFLYYEGDAYEEYMLINHGTASEPSYNFELIGGTTVDLADYAKTADITKWADETFLKDVYLTPYDYDEEDCALELGYDAFPASGKKALKVDVKDSGIQTKHIQDAAVDTDKIADKAVTVEKLADDVFNKLNGDYKTKQTAANGTLTGAQVVSTWSQNANGEVAITTRNLTPADIGAAPADNYKIKQTAVTDKITDVAHVLDSLTQNANGEISYTVKKMTTADIGAQKKSVFVDQLPTTGEEDTIYYKTNKVKYEIKEGYAVTAKGSLYEDSNSTTIMVEAPFGYSVIVPHGSYYETGTIVWYAGDLEFAQHNQWNEYEEEGRYIYPIGTYVPSVRNTASGTITYAVVVSRSAITSSTGTPHYAAEGCYGYAYKDGKWECIFVPFGQEDINHVRIGLSEFKEEAQEQIANINRELESMSGIAKTGSIYDIKEGANDNTGSDKVANPKYLIFNCGSSTNVI